MKLKRHFFELFALFLVAALLVWKFWPAGNSNVAPVPAKATSARAVKQAVGSPKFRWLAAAQTPGPPPDSISIAQTMLNGPGWSSAGNAQYFQSPPQPKDDITDFGQVEFADGETMVLFLNNGKPIYVTPRLFPDGKIHTIFQQQGADIKGYGFTQPIFHVTNSITFPGEAAVFNVGENSNVYITPMVKKSARSP